MITKAKITNVIATVAVFGTTGGVYHLLGDEAPRGADLSAMDLFQKLT
jgi:hypothetical protein